MTRDDLEAILAVKEGDAGRAGRRRPHFHECVMRCRILEPCADRFCPDTPSGRRLPCTHQGYRLLRLKVPRDERERQREMHTEPRRNV